jgi:hypothetical protein
MARGLAAGAGNERHIMMNSLPWTYPPDAAQRQRALRHVAASALRRASALLARLAQQLATADRRDELDTGPLVLEFHAEAGAPEGALYVNGRLVGRLEGVRRL